MRIDRFSSVARTRIVRVYCLHPETQPPQLLDKVSGLRGIILNSAGEQTYLVNARIKFARGGGQGILSTLAMITIPLSFLVFTPQI